MADPSSTSFLPPIVAFCAAAVVAVPLARRLGVGGVLGYMLAGIVIGPSVLGVVRDAAAVRHVAELGVVLLLFIIGLELKISRLISMRRDIFGLGAVQVVVTALAIGIVAWAFGVGAPGAAVV
ncbi:MAG: cation:proton antiporter, partial [Beijerinckiaceae bacterium]